MFYFTDNYQEQTDNIRSVMVNHSIHDLSELFERFRVSLQIPYTTMTNFPAFRDVMEELDWVQEDEIRIYHDSLPSLDEETLACYLDYLNLIDVEWEKYEERADIVREYMNKTGQVHAQSFNEGAFARAWHTRDTQSQGLACMGQTSRYDLLRQFLMLGQSTLHQGDGLAERHAVALEDAVDIVF